MVPSLKVGQYKAAIKQARMFGLGKFCNASLIFGIELRLLLSKWGTTRCSTKDLASLVNIRLAI
jgi:hypothetical protein